MLPPQKLVKNPLFARMLAGRGIFWVKSYTNRTIFVKNYTLAHKKDALLRRGEAWYPVVKRKAER